jgi:uncharacterized protein YndB with AHSA1/START domain
VSTSDSIRVTTVVAADPASAFELFTREVDAWWRRGPRFRHGGGRPSVMRFEGGEGGRLLEVYSDAAGGSFEVGRVLSWKPGDRLVFEWRANNFEPGLVTEVEVRFERAQRGTRVTLEHRGWDRVPEDHASRHGYGTSNAFVSMIGLSWGDQLTALRAHAGARGGDAGQRPRERRPS